MYETGTRSETKSDTVLAPPAPEIDLMAARWDGISRTYSPEDVLRLRGSVRIEHTLAQMNQFQVLAQVFWHARESHGPLVRVVGMLVNRRVQVRPLASYPAPSA